MKYYAVAAITVTDPSWVPEYLQEVSKMVASVGGRYLSRTDQFEVLEGESSSAQSFSIVEFPSKEVAQEFYDSEAYKPYKEKRLKGSEGTFYLVAGEDMAAG